MRKSPFKHNVSGHYREGKYIDNYDRGKGKRPNNPIKPSLGRGLPDAGFSVTMYYPSGRRTLPVKAGTFTEALMRGFDQADGGDPSHVRVRRNRG